MNENNFRLLVVEDVDIAQKIASMVLESLGFSVDISADGETALKMFQQKHYDFIFMDIGLPGMDGLETTRAIRQIEKIGMHVPIVALTANSENSHKSMCLASGMDEFLSKPLVKDKAINMINQFIPFSSYTDKER